jgi:hypothetical protein
VICVKQMGAGTVFVLLFVFFCPYALYSSSSLYYSCHKTNGRSQENFKEPMLLRTSGIIGQESTFASSLFASFMLQNLNFVPVYAEKKMERAYVVAWKFLEQLYFLLPCPFPLFCSSFPKEVYFPHYTFYSSPPPLVILPPLPRLLPLPPPPPSNLLTSVLTRNAT